MKKYVRVGIGLSVAVLSLTGWPTAATAVTAAAREPSPRVAIDALMAGSPSDAQLAGRSDSELAALSVRCTALDGRTYCLHMGWMDQAPTPEHLGEIVKTQANDGASANVAVESRGDLPLAAQVRKWAKQPREVRLQQERAELEDARAALGKVKLFDYLIAGASVPDGFWARYPETQAWGKRLTQKETARGDVGVNCLECNAVGDPGRAQKQITGFYCGPASMVALAWNDPVRGNELSPHGFANQDFWAMRLGTTTDGTAITSLAANINEHLTWRNRIGSYVVVSHSGWDVATWQNLWRVHIWPGLEAPVQLHPKLNAGNNTFGMTTSGHFNVGRGYNFDVTEPIWRISIWESAGGSRVPLSYWETHANIIAANRNHPMQNIAY